MDIPFGKNGVVKLVFAVTELALVVLLIEYSISYMLIPIIMVGVIYLMLEKEPKPYMISLANNYQKTVTAPTGMKTLFPKSWEAVQPDKYNGDVLRFRSEKFPVAFHVIELEDTNKIGVMASTMDPDQNDPTRNVYYGPVRDHSVGQVLAEIVNQHKDEDTLADAMKSLQSFGFSLGTPYRKKPKPTAQPQQAVLPKVTPA